MSARPITKLALVQSSLVILSFFGLGALLKIQGYPQADVRWNPLTVFLRERGMWLLLLPTLWVLFSVYSERKWSGAISESDSLIIGICLAVAIFLLFIFAAVNSHTRPIIRRMSKEVPTVKVSKRFSAVGDQTSPPAEPPPR
jgi:hypothetical protein